MNQFIEFNASYLYPLKKVTLILLILMFQLKQV